MNVKILIIDDTKSHRDHLAELLEGTKTEIFFAGNGEDGLQKMKDIENIEFVITDLDMPKMDGIEMMKQLSQDENLKGIPVAFCTRHFNSKNSVEAKKMGATIFLPKPMFSIDQLIKIIERVLNKEIR